MLDNYTRGGQLFLHKIRMLKQVFNKTLLGSFIISFAIMLVFSHKKLAGLDYSAGITYSKAYISEKASNTLENKKNSSPKITAIVKDKIYAKEISANQILNNKIFKNEFNLIMDAYYVLALNILNLTTIILLFNMLVWSKVGSKALEKDIIKGSKVLTAKEVSSILRKSGKASHFKIGEMPLVKDKETSHILVTGTTGSGKSNCMYHLLPQIRNQNQSAIIVDFTGEMVQRYYSKERGDKIINPFDQSASTWDFWREVEDTHNLASLSNSLFTSRGSNYDEMWNNASKKFFEDAVRTISKYKNKSIKMLYNTLSSDPLIKVVKQLIGTSSASMLDPKNDKTAMSIRTNTIAFIDWMEDFQENEDYISITDWIKSISIKPGKWLFLSSSPKQRNRLRNFHSMLMDLILNNIMELGADNNRRIWLVIDELPALKQLPSLPTALSELRKYGGCIMAGIQSTNQLLEIYGQNSAYAMIDQFNTKFIFRTDDNNFASYICKNFGEIEYEESSENFSYGAHEMRDGVSFSKLEKRKPLITPSDLSSLSDREAYVKLPDPSVRISKILMDYITSQKIFPKL